MKVSNVIAEIENVEIIIRDFIEKENVIGDIFSSPDDWNANDIVGHITGWIVFSKSKLACIIENSPFVDIENLEEFNNTIFLHNRDKKTSELFDNFHDAITQYKQVILQFGDSQLMSKTYKTGFSFELWRYMILDGVIHPIMHLLYHYLKYCDFQEFKILVFKTEGIFSIYSQGCIDVYDFGEFSDETSKTVQKLIEMRNEDPTNEFIAKIIDYNILKYS